MTDLLTKCRTPLLDGRLSTAMAMAERCHIFADIGADHGRLSAVMLSGDQDRRALVADISVQALQKSQDLLTRLHLCDRAVFAVANGLDALDQWSGPSPDTIFILGMGGDTVSGILRRGSVKLNGAALILGAQTDLPLVRRTLCDIGYHIQHETVVSQGKHDYLLIRAEKGQAIYTEEELLLGPVLLKTHPQSWLPLLEKRERLLQNGLKAMRTANLVKDFERLRQFETEIFYVKRALEQLRKE